MIGNMMRSLRRSAGAVAAAAALASTIGAAQPAQAYPSYRTIQLKTSTGKCLTIRNQSTSDGAVLEQNRCQNVAAQRFKSVSFGVVDPVHVVRTFTDKCLTIGSASEGNTHFWPIIQQQCVDGSYHQRFTYFGDGRPGTGFRSFSMGLCWTVTGGNDGARIEGDACDRPDSQRFTIVFV
ncbi:RICIN domain-containing protein [Streptomyces sp. Ac-502]|uniref:RICIN domain-containing protein n=1 Tax=Streptomyces sp. Ac-502 TaxID=3342801 RepID=UPI0038627240